MPRDFTGLGFRVFFPLSFLNYQEQLGRRVRDEGMDAFSSIPSQHQRQSRVWEFLKLRYEIIEGDPL